MSNYLIYAKIGTRVNLVKVSMSVGLEQVLEPEIMDSHVGKMESDRLQEIIKCCFLRVESLPFTIFSSFLLGGTAVVPFIVRQTLDHISLIEIEYSKLRYCWLA